VAGGEAAEASVLAAANVVVDDRVPAVADLQMLDGAAAGVRGVGEEQRPITATETARLAASAIMMSIYQNNKIYALDLLERGYEDDEAPKPWARLEVIGQ
jgi:hypothetical protein